MALGAQIGQDQPAEASGGRAAVTVLDQALWRDLRQTTDEKAFATAWLGLTCRAIEGAIGGALLPRDPEAAPGLEAVWPEGGGLPPDLAAAIAAASETGRGVMRPPADGGTASLALPIQLDDAVLAIAAIRVALPPGRDARGAMRQLQWSSAWVRDRLRAIAAKRAAEAGARTGTAIDLLAAALEQPTAKAAARAVATELAAHLACDRVSIGFLRGGRCRLESISHSAGFGEEMALTRAIEEAMDEAIDQFALVLTPPPNDAVLMTAAHDRLAAMHAPATVLTVPLLMGEAVLGALTLERPVLLLFAAADIGSIEAVAAILGPALAGKRMADRSVPRHIWDAAHALCVSITGPGHLKRKLWLAAASVLGLLAAVVHGDYTVHAHARIAGSVQRAVTAPFDGFIREAPVRAGEEVRANALIAALDDRDLVLERLRWVTERQVHLAEYDQALSAGKRADAVRLQSQIAQAQAQIHLADEQLARTRMIAPFDGLVVSGDLSQSIGAPVRRGDVLFEIAPLNDYRVELRIPESQVADVVPGAAGQLVVAALPDEPLTIAIERIVPVADAKDGQVTFHADALVGSHSGRLRPGMEGIAKIDAGRARVVWIWTRSLRHWLRWTTWSWLP